MLLKLFLISGLALSTACTDVAPIEVPVPSVPTSAYRADVALSWMNMQLKLAQKTPGTPAIAFGRPLAYTAIAGYEAAVPGMRGYKSLCGQLNGLTSLPTADKNLAYNWPLSANAALAAMNRSLFSNTSVANLASLDSLEAANTTAYQAGLQPEVVSRSVAFGKQVASAVLEWSRTDGYNNTSAYTPPTGPGLWVPTPPAFSPAGFPFWGANRTLVAGSGTNTDPGPYTAYSETVGSPFYVMAKEVLNVSQTLTSEQRAIALFWNDAPNGQNFTPPGHWLSILTQVIAKENNTLDKALVAYAKLTIHMNDALISSFQAKYKYSLLRPVSYIRAVLDQPTWSSLIPAPSFPEYPSNHAILSSAAADVLTQLYGPNYAFTDQKYVQFGLGTRSYSSFEQAAIEAGLSRFYGGIHYRTTAEISIVQGRKVAQNINARLKFR